MRFHARSIIDIEVEKLKKRLERKNIFVIIEPKAKEHLVEKPGMSKGLRML